MKRMDELMDEYQVLEETDYDTMALTEEEKRKILNDALKKVMLEKKGIPEVKKRKGFSRKRIVVLAIAATLCIGTVFGFATDYFQMSDTLKAFFNIGNEQPISGVAGNKVDIQLIEDGWTLDVKEVIGDSKSIYILYDIIAPEGTVLDEASYSFRKQRLEVNSLGSYSGGWYSEELEDSDLSDNIKSFLFCGSVSGDLNGKSITFEVGELSKYSIEKGDFELVFDSQFKTTFPLNYTISSKTVKVNQEISVFEGKAELKTIEISPLSAIVTIEGDAIKKHDEKPPAIDQEPFNEMARFAIIMKDGTVLKDMNSGSEGIEKDRFTFIVQYKNLIDLDNLKEVRICGITVPFGK